MDAETVVEAVQVDAAATAAATVANTTAGEVEAVGAVLEEHAELSEERHEEILEGESWIRNQLVLLLTNSQTILSTIAAMQISVTTELASNRAAIESMASRSQTRVEAEPIPEVQPLAAVVVVPEVPATPEPEPPAKRRRVKVI